MLQRLCTFLLVLLCFAGHSQSISSSLRKARKAVDDGDFAKGASYYKEALAKDSTHLNANLEYGLLLFEYMNEPTGAGSYLLRAEKRSGKDTMPELIYGLGKYYHYKGDFHKAIAYYKRFYTRIDLKDKDGIVLEREVSRYLTNCTYSLENPVTVNRKRLRVKNAGKGINTIYPEYVPVSSGDKKTLMFTSRRKVNDNSRIDVENGGYYEDMYMAQRDKDGTFKDPHPFSLQGAKMPGSQSRHEASISLSFVGDRFFTFYDGRIYESVKQGDTWSNPAMLNDNLNQKNEFRNHVCISKDGQTLYYSAERSNGVGGLDIYKSVKQADGGWGPGESMGTDINTREDEGGPQLNEDGTVLYFSSRGLPGYGGYDFFKTKWNGSSWSKPENLGKPFNSAGDDIYLSVNELETEGFLSSSRAGGFGDMDIYEVVLAKPFDPFKNDSLGRMVVMVPDTVYLGDTVSMSITSSKLPPSVFSNYYWQVNDSVLSKEGNTIAYSFSKPGMTTIRVQAELNEWDFDLIGGEKSIFVTERNITTIVSNTTTVVTNTMVTNNTLPLLETVYFDFNSADINAMAATALDRNLEILRKQGATIEISAYCDARGSVAYNRTLSQRRGLATLNYLKKKGFNVKLVKRTDWFGERNPVNRCADGVECTEEEYRMNRRVEIRWVEVKK